MPVDLPAPESLESEISIPPALAAVKPRKLKVAKPAADAVSHVATAAVVAAPVVTPPAPLNPTAAAPADTVTEEPTMATTIENMTDTTAHKAEAFTADMGARAKDAMGKGAQFFTELNSFNKGNVEALVESGKLAVAGMQSMAQNQAAFARKQFETATAAARELAGVKSPTEFVKLQGDYVRQQFDGAVAEMSRSTETMLKLVGEVVQPISNRVAVAVERVKMAA